jgi:hypothetical protein
MGLDNSDYARERLGMSAREMQSLAAVSTGLERLPEVGAAFERGELSWSQARLLIGVATPDTEVEWLALACGRTVRALAALIRKGGRSATEDDGEDEEPRARFRLRCSRRLLRLWGHVVELARRMAGSQLSQGEAAEAIAAEGFAARPPCGEPWREGWRDAPGPVDPGESRSVFAELDWAAVAEAIPQDVERLSHGVDDLDAAALDERMGAVVRAMHRIDWQLGRLLRVFLDRRLYRLMWFASAARYLTERLGISARKARALVALERKSWEAPALGDAYRAGEISALQALTVLPVVAEQSAPAWVARAQAVTLRRLVDEVEWALTVRDGLTPIARHRPGHPSPSRTGTCVRGRNGNGPMPNSSSTRRCPWWRSSAPPSSPSRIPPTGSRVGSSSSSST